MNCKTFLIDQDLSEGSMGGVSKKMSCLVCLRTGHSVRRCTNVSLSSSQNLTKGHGSWQNRDLCLATV